MYIYFYAVLTSNMQHPTTLTNSLRLIRSCNNIVIDDNFLEKMGSSKIEELGPLMHDHTTRYRAKQILKNYLEGISGIARAQLLHRLLKQKCIKDAIKLLGIKSVKEVKTNEMVSKNLTSTLATLAMKRSRDLKFSRKTLLTWVVEKNTTTGRLLAMTARTLKTSRISLWKHKNIRVQLDEDDEVACCADICTQPYQDKLADNVRE